MKCPWCDAEFNSVVAKDEHIAACDERPSSKLDSGEVYIPDPRTVEEEDDEDGAKVDKTLREILDDVDSAIEESEDG